MIVLFIILAQAYIPSLHIMKEKESFFVSFVKNNGVIVQGLYFLFLLVIVILSEVKNEN